MEPTLLLHSSSFVHCVMVKMFRLTTTIVLVAFAFSAISIVVISCDDNPNPTAPPFVNKIVRDIDNLISPEEHEELTPEDLNTDYDFIVIGSGPAGCAVANRLSENPSVTVLLLEAGPRPTTIQRVPVFAMYADQPGYNWGYSINPYPGSCLALRDQHCSYPMGKMLGGSSSLNYLVYARGNADDYDRWERLGNYGWSYNDLLPLFRKLENTLLVHEVDPNYRGIEGPLSVTHATYRSELTKTFVESSMERGKPFLDYNGRTQIGVNYVQATATRNGRRQTAADAYLTPIKDRRNLHVMVNCLVSKLIIDPETKTAQGVEYIFEGVTYRAFSTKEVILSAGPINSPQLLMLSGIGPKEDLKRMNIPVLANLLVGRNYEDHMMLATLIFQTNTTGENINLMDLNEYDVEQFVQGTGKLTVPAALEGISMHHLGISNVSPDTAELEFMFTPGRNEAGFTGYTNYRDDIYEAVFQPTEDPSREFFSYAILDLYPKGRGNITLRGNSILNPPIIDYPFLENPRDMEAMLMAIKEALAISQTEGFKTKGAKLHDIPIPDCAYLSFASDDYWRCYIRHMVRNNCHISSSCKMGAKSNPTAVVSPELQVYGIDRLRVADTSIAPTQIAGHSQAVAYLIGEKMATILKKYWQI